MDEITELKRIWESTEMRLSSLSGEQERVYSIAGNIDKLTVNIPVNFCDDEIIELLKDESILTPDINYHTDDDGSNDTIEIHYDFDDSLALTMSTNDEIEDFDSFMDDILDIERTQYLSSGKWETKEYTIVIGTGGPHVEFTTNYQINVYWGGKSQEFTTYDDNARSTIDRVCEYLDETSNY